MAGTALKRLMAEYKHSSGLSVSVRTASEDSDGSVSSVPVLTACVCLAGTVNELTLNPPEGIVAGPMNEENFFEWEALIMGPEDTCFEFGVFPAILSFPLDYPLSPPKMRFTCEMFHPNNGVVGKRINKEVCCIKREEVPFYKGLLALIITILMTVEKKSNLPRRQSLHLHPACPRRRPHGLREQRRAVEPRAERGEDPAVGEPNDESGANVDASKMWRDDREQFYKVAKQIVQKSLGL
ncbi:ubiquitin-conjugating enzyme E2 G2 isoform X5 [Camelus bactrianus]|uniref:Ubiquitin-conjugating enzyme E2 G2 isoform X5 n=1 Tax=Camelus bactrianus TaxID=9837 RepID=A0AC58RK12_CAMBA